MGLSLSGGTRKTRIGADPRNTQWANDTERFGHQQLVRMGWKPGRGLGSSVEGAKEHVKVKVKADATGLGRPGQQDQPTGLDVFQRILGKLNGTEEEVEKQIEDKQRLTGLYMHFVPGGRLEGTVKDAKEMKKDRKKVEKQRKKAEKAAERAARDAKKKLKKRGGGGGGGGGGKSIKHAIQDGQAPQPAFALSSASASSAASVSPSSASVSSAAAPASLSAASVSSSAGSAASSAAPSPEPAKSACVPSARGIRATRSRYIEMKRKATADSQSLKEILMQ